MCTEREMRVVYKGECHRNADCTLSGLAYPVMLTAFLLTALSFGLGALAAFPNPLPLSGTAYIHDPSLIQRVSDGKYYLFSTHNRGAILTATNLAGCVRISYYHDASLIPL